MQLKFALDSLEGLDESMQSLYSEHDGKFYLNVDGAVDKSKLAEFRDQNIELREKLERFSGVDLDKYNEMQTKLQDQERKKMVPVSKVDEMLNERVSTMKSDYEANIEGLNKSNATLTTQLESLVIDSAVRQAATKHKVADSAVDDVILRAKSTFRMENGQAVPYNGKEVVYDKDGSTPMSIDSWVKGLGKSAPHLFVTSNGSGAIPGQGNLPKGMSPANMTPLQKIQQGLEN